MDTIEYATFRYDNVQMENGLNYCNESNNFKVSTSFLPVQPCDSSPCQNDAICENKGCLYVCHCREGYEGFQCENKGIVSWTFFLVLATVFIPGISFIISDSM